MNEDDKLLKVLEIEINRTNHLDTILFNIKVWTTTLVVVLIGIVSKLSGQAQTVPAENKRLLIFAVVSTIIFFIIDVHFRSIQLRHVQSIGDIRRQLRALSEAGLSSNVWQKLYGGEMSERKKGVQWFHDYWYTLLVYALILTMLILHF